MENKTTETTTEERLSWHKPEIQSLTVNLDTAGQIPGLISAVDLAGEG